MALINPVVNDVYPIGSIVESSVHPGNDWLICDGSILQQSDYPILVANATNLHPHKWNNWETVVQCSYEGIYTYSYGGLGITTEGGKIVFVSEKWGTSVDGVTWNGGELPAGHSNLITYNSTIGLYVAVSDYSSTDQYQTSPDGENWTLRTLPTADYWRVFFSHKNKIYGIEDDNIWHTTDGINWNPGGTLSFYPPDDTVCVSDGSNIVLISDYYKDWIVYSDDDGLTWEYKNLRYGYEWLSLAYGNGTFVIAGDDYNPYIGYSTDGGVNWTTIFHGFYKSGSYQYANLYPVFDQIIYADGDFIFRPDRSSTSGLYTSDLKRFDKIDFPGYEHYDMCYFNNYLYYFDQDAISRTTKYAYDHTIYFQLPNLNNDVNINNYGKRYYIRVK